MTIKFHLCVLLHKKRKKFEDWSRFRVSSKFNQIKCSKTQSFAPPGGVPVSKAVGPRIESLSWQVTICFWFVQYLRFVQKEEEEAKEKEEERKKGGNFPSFQWINSLRLDVQGGSLCYWSLQMCYGLILSAVEAYKRNKSVNAFNMLAIYSIYKNHIVFRACYLNRTKYTIKIVTGFYLIATNRNMINQRPDSGIV